MSHTELTRTDEATQVGDTMPLSPTLPVVDACGGPTLDLSIVVVSYNTRELTLQCLKSIYEQTTGIRFEVLVVDNASSDNSASVIGERFPDVRLFSLRENLGFAMANNYAARQARGEWLLLLNPDTIVIEQAITRLLSYARLCRHGRIFGGQTLYPDGSLNPTSCWGRPTLWTTACFGLGLTVLSEWVSALGRESLAGWRRDSERNVDIISGCFLLLRRDLWERLNGFDPQFRMYGEDFDLCLRAAALGEKCVFWPDARIIHYGGASERVKPDQLVRQMRAKVLLIRKHWPPLTASAGVALVSLRVLTRAVGFTLLSRILPTHAHRASSWSHAWRRRHEWRIANER